MKLVVKGSQQQKMNSGKNNGGKSPAPAPAPAPAPLPMYRPVALKHVPTMVRSRYDPDLRRPTSGMNSEDSRKSADDGAKVVNISNSVSTSIENRQDDVHAKSDNEQGLALEDLNDSKSKVDGVNDVDTSVDDTQNNDFRPYTYDGENKNEEAEVGNNPAAVVSDVDDKETEHDLLASFGTEPDTYTYTEEFGSSDLKLNTKLTSDCEYQCDEVHENTNQAAVVNHLEGSTRDGTPIDYDTLANMGIELDFGSYDLGPIASMNSEDSSKNADFGAEEVNHTSFVNTGIDYRQDNGHAKSDCDQGLASEDLKDRGNQGEKVDYVDTSVDDDAKDDRQKNVFRLNTFLQRLGVHSTQTRLDKVLVWISKSYDNTHYGNKLLTAAVIATVFYLWRNKKY